MDLFVIGDEVSGRYVSAYFNAHAFAVGVIVDRRVDETDVAILLGPFGLSIWWGDPKSLVISGTPDNLVIRGVASETGTDAFRASARGAAARVAFEHVDSHGEVIKGVGAIG